MSDSPVIYSDLGDGKRRRFFLGADELRQIKTETGRGFFSLYMNFDKDAEPDEVAAVLRLALIGGGETPKDALQAVNYYARPPRPMKDAYTLAFECLNAAWAGTESKEGAGTRLSVAEMDGFFVEVEAALLKADKDLSVLRGKSFAEIQAVFAALNSEDTADAVPDADTFNAIKELSAKMRGKAASA
jgi:hypothetical protein